MFNNDKTNWWLHDPLCDTCLWKKKEKQKLLNIESRPDSMFNNFCFDKWWQSKLKNSTSIIKFSLSSDPNRVISVAFEMFS